MSVYPDYLAAPNITNWLTRELKMFHDQVPFDGLWLDMCEPSNFCTGMNCKPDPKNATAMHCKCAFYTCFGYFLHTFTFFSTQHLLYRHKLQTRSR